MDELISLREENGVLRERVRQLEDLLAPQTTAIRPEWRLVNAEARIFAALTRRDVCTKEVLHAALYADRMLDDPPSLSAVESHVCHLRRKLKPYGITLTSARFVGYSLMNRHMFSAVDP